MMPAELSKEFSDATANLSKLRCLELPPCSGAIAQSIASRLESLVYFSAEYLCSDGDILNTKNNQRFINTLFDQFWMNLLTHYKFISMNLTKSVLQSAN